jgi:CheY-like chemotaxis protein
MTKQVLERQGYAVDGYTSSIKALKEFQKNANVYDMVISDMTMPQMTGDKLAQELIKIRPNIPILLCTGFSETITVEKARLLGIKDLLMKPVVVSELAKTVRKVLNEHRSS